MRTTDVTSYFNTVVQVIAQMPLATVDRIVQMLLQAYESNRMIYLFGNGGSAALASFACDLGKEQPMAQESGFRC
jgi:phosphoheptose isomerase